MVRNNTYSEAREGAHGEEDLLSDIVSENNESSVDIHVYNNNSTHNMIRASISYIFVQMFLKCL